MRLAACQPTEILGDIEAAIETIERFTQNAQIQQADLICFPECFIGGYTQNLEQAKAVAIELNGPIFTKIAKRLADFNPIMVVGLIEHDGTHLYNTAVVLHKGKLIGRYRKQHLLKHEQFFSPGIDQPVFSLLNTKFGINICYDNQFSGAAKNMVTKGATIILCPSNNMLPTLAAKKYKHLHNPCRARRAIDHHCWYISSDVTGKRDGHLAFGPTSAIDPTGKTVAQLPLGVPDILIIDF